RFRYASSTCVEAACNPGLSGRAREDGESQQARSRWRRRCDVAPVKATIASPQRPIIGRSPAGGGVEHVEGTDSSRHGSRDEAASRRERLSGCLVKRKMIGATRLHADPNEKDHSESRNSASPTSAEASRSRIHHVHLSLGGWLQAEDVRCASKCELSPRV